MDAFKKWLATSPVASMLKIALGAALGALLGYLPTSGWEPLAVAIGAAVIPVLINWVNDDDLRYGRIKAQEG